MEQPLGHKYFISCFFLRFGLTNSEEDGRMNRFQFRSVPKDQNFYARKAFLLLCLICCSMVYGQSTWSDRNTFPVPFDYLTLDEPNINLKGLLESNPTFLPGNTLQFENLKTTYWVRLDFKNNLEHLKTSKGWRLRTKDFSKAFIFFNENGQIHQRPVGKFNKQEEKASFIYTPGIYFTNDQLIDNQYLYLKIQLTFALPGKPKFEYLSDANNRFYTQYYNIEDLKQLFPDQIYLGACGIIFITFLVVYLNIHKLEFLFYALYVLFSIVYLLQDNLLIPGYINFYDSLFGYWSVVISQVLINLFYIAFAVHYLDTKKKHPLLHTSMHIIIGFLTVLVITDFLVFFTGNYVAHSYLLNIQRLVMTLFGIVSMAYLLMVCKDKLAIFVVVGSFIYMVGALGYLFTLNKHLMVLGSSIEIIIFSLGLAYKIKLEYEGRLTLQQEVMSKEINVLRAQMNPHFVFNALSSIQHLILQNNRKAALSYLSKFSKLARNVLESSREAIVSLTEEIDLLRSYLELESLRFDNAFSYSIVVDESLETDIIEVPLMLLQPFAENAIIHGLVGKKKGKKCLCIRIQKMGNFCIIEIEDNGIGRIPYISVNKEQNRTSCGMKITQRRLKMLHDSEENKNTLEIVDKFDSKGNPAGTKVIIKLYNP